MYRCERWTIKKAESQRIDAFELWCWKILLKSPLDSTEIKPINPKGNQPRMFIGRTDAEAPILWLPDAKNWLIWKNPDAGKDWGQEEKGTTEDEMVGWHHQLDGHEFEQAPGVGDRQGNLACCSPWGCKVGHDWVTELKQRAQLLADNELQLIYFVESPASEIKVLCRFHSFNIRSECLLCTYSMCWI